MLLCLVATEIDSSKRQAEADRRKYDELLHERDMLNKVCVLWLLWYATLVCLFTHNTMLYVQYVCVLFSALVDVDPEEG